MSTEPEIKIVSKTPDEFSSVITIHKRSYTVLTENLGQKACRVVSFVYSDGQIVFSRKSDYSHLKNVRRSESELCDLMEQQHRATIHSFMESRREEQRPRTDFFYVAQSFMESGNKVIAFETIEKGLEVYPKDPFLMSYYGYLVADVRQNVDKGIHICKEAISQLNRAVPFGREYFYPMLYLYLGKAYLQKSRFEAIESFQMGLQNDPENRELIRELDKLGARRRPFIPFLDRENPINKYFGMALSRVWA
jgi:tetratricopeptide (TPR) repeat protein